MRPDLPSRMTAGVLHATTSTTSTARTRRRGRAQRAMAALALLIGIAAWLVGCGSMRLTPPAAVKNPVDVLVVDYGYHASLWLPHGPDPVLSTESPTPGVEERHQGWSEFAFGEWEWFGRGRDEWWRAPGVILGSGPGCLARRVMDQASRADELAAWIRSHWRVDDVLVLRVEAPAVNALRVRLDREVDAGWADRIERSGKVFVPSATEYSGSSNCNHAVGQWLESLGVQVHGRRSWARFTLAKPEADKRQSAPARP